jgi:hypothetical protein
MRLKLSAMIYNLGNWRGRLLHPHSVEGWPVASLPQRRVKGGG